MRTKTSPVALSCSMEIFWSKMRNVQHSVKQNKGNYGTVAYGMSITVTWDLKTRNKDFIKFKLFLRIITSGYICDILNVFKDEIHSFH
jgi:hypothetical protein